MAGTCETKNTAIEKKWRNKQRESAAASAVIRESLQEHVNMIRCAALDEGSCRVRMRKSAGVSHQRPMNTVRS